MKELSGEEQERKKAIFETMSPKRQGYILKIGYDAWDPFAPPKDPIDLRKARSEGAARAMVRQFLQSRNGQDDPKEYVRGAVEICSGLIRREASYSGMYDFACWYQKFAQKDGAQ
ncbi:MAG: hypothetical protein Q8P24_17130 [Desulfobacterales bacterium]|nr:hypothetical protein [Desulfobacterales bacterium]